MKHSTVKNNVSAMYPIRLKYVERKKIEIVAADKGRKVSEHLHWLILNLYETMNLRLEK